MHPTGTTSPKKGFGHGPCWFGEGWLSAAVRSGLGGGDWHWIPISWCMAQGWCHLAGSCSVLAPFWAAQISLCTDVQESYSTEHKGSKNPVISQPCCLVKPSLSTSLPFLPAPASQTVPAWLFPACAWCCQLSQEERPAGNIWPVRKAALSLMLEMKGHSQLLTLSPL